MPLLLCLTVDCRLHVLGQEALVSEEEAVVAAWHTGGSAGRDRPHRRHLYPRHDHRDPGVGRQEAAHSLSDSRAQQEERRHHWRGRRFGNLSVNLTQPDPLGLRTGQ